MFLVSALPGLTSKPVVSMSFVAPSVSFTLTLAASSESRKFTQIDDQVRAALGDHDLHAIADRFLQAGLGDVRRTQLAGAQLAGDVVGGVRHDFLGGERDAAFENCEDQHGERDRQQRELDGGACRRGCGRIA